MLAIFLQAGGGLGGFLPLLLVLVVMYFFFFRPQIKRQKEEKKFSTEGLSKGMRVVTNSGVHGKILEIQDTTVILESENSRLKLERSAISRELSAIYLPKEEKKTKETKTK
ncbi:MAG TPA: preprotein translocase subunit YajC [Cryomorphaceae bacterium]|nr:preprotein translocase subunit YajC [Owenweeksia sp.]MBF99681.1 preprotein translocase subunit YajC [Owenweeksia sp.]HAD97785.1 preprotein translocase subunit YajC [Cryomorphaceae bacterium]HBF21704.1 preprotein translocase subunit YajC [Cryomorphaceae bacterium]|tara:strand:+ start:2850 stop:3182 length:333 start_codon:yes stop_codon:yes gene_type:complete